jgi:hypothetical protein
MFENHIQTPLCANLFSCAEAPLAGVLKPARKRNLTQPSGQPVVARQRPPGRLVIFNGLRRADTAAPDLRLIRLAPEPDPGKPHGKRMGGTRRFAVFKQLKAGTNNLKPL